MRARLTGNVEILARCLHSRLSHHFHFGAASSSFCRGGLVVSSERALNYHRLGFFSYLTDSLCRALLSRRSYKGTTLAMASAFQPELARQPPSVPLPKAPNGGKYKLAACQLAKVSDKEANIANARDRIEAAADKGAQLIILPELWNCPIGKEFFRSYAEDIDAGLEACPTLAMIAEVARKKKITIVGGSIPERSGDNVYNTCCVFDKSGDMKAKFRKLHLFDVDIPGGITFKESDDITPGDLGLCVVDTDVGRLAIGICYDIRFPEMAMLYAARGAHIICYPAAFNMTTGPVHWELLQKARAVDNQIFVVTCSPARDTSASYINWGHSTIVGPFGEILATTEHEEATIFADIDYAELDTRRQNMPLESQRRGDLYRLTDVTRKE